MASRVTLFGKQVSQGPRIKKLNTPPLVTISKPSSGTLKAFGFGRDYASNARVQRVTVRTTSSQPVKSKAKSITKRHPRKRFSRILDDDAADGVDIIDDDDDDDYDEHDAYDASMIDDAT